MFSFLRRKLSFVTLLLLNLLKMLNAITKMPAPNETDCKVQRFEEGSIIAHYQIRVGEENPALAEEYLDEFEEALQEIVTEDGQTILTKDGQGSITIEKLIRGKYLRLMVRKSMGV